MAVHNSNITVYENWSLLAVVNEQRAKYLSPVIAYLALLMFFGIFGNILILYVYGAVFKKTTTSYFILCLASVDLVSCALGLPFEITDVWYNSYFYNAYLCKAARFFINFLIMVSVLCLLVVAFDRYFKICMPHKRPLLRSIRPLFIGCFVLAVLFSWPLFFIFGFRSTIIIVKPNYVIQGITCSLDENTPKLIARVYLGTLGCMFCISSMFMITVYSLLIYSLYKHERNNSMSRSTELGLTQSPSTTHLAQSYAKSISSRTKIERNTRIFVTITAIFILSFLPNLILLLLKTLNMLDNFETTASIAYNIFVRSQYVNNVANPFLYGFFNPLFRQQCKTILCSKIMTFIDKKERDNFEETENCGSTSPTRRNT